MNKRTRDFRKAMDKLARYYPREYALRFLRLIQPEVVPAKRHWSPLAILCLFGIHAWKPLGGTWYRSGALVMHGCARKNCPACARAWRKA